MNNTLPLVDFKTAKRLKKLGFNYPVNNFFRDKVPCLSFTKINFNDLIYEMSQPKFGLVFQWLREEKKIIVSIKFCRFKKEEIRLSAYSGNNEHYMWHIFDSRQFEMNNYNSKELEHRTFAKAQQSALTKALDILEGKEG